MSALDPPAGMDDARRAIWRDTVQALLAAGTIAVIDVNGLAAYVTAVHTWRRAGDLLARSDVLIERDGRAVPNPALGVQAQAADIIARFARQYRLTAHRPEPVRAAEPMRGPAPGADPGPERAEDGTWYCAEHQTTHGHCRNKDGTRCHGQLKAGLLTCRMHQGGAPEAKHVAAVLERERTYGEPVRISAADAILHELWRTAGHVKWLGERVADLEAAALTWGTERTVTRFWGEFPGSETVAKAGPHVLLDLYERERRHLVHVAAEILRVGLAERMLDTAKRQGEDYARVTDAILRDLDLTAEQWARVPEVVPRRFRELAS